MSALTDFLFSIAKAVGGVLLIFGGATALLGWYDDRPDNVTKGFWIMGSGAAIMSVSAVVGEFVTTIAPGAVSEAPLPPLVGTSLGKALKDYGAISGFIIWCFESIVGIAKVPIWAVQEVAYLTATKVNGLTTAFSVLNTAALAFYGYFALLELSNQYRHISQMGGGDLASFGIPIQLIIRLAIPLFCLNGNVIPSIISFFANLLQSGIGWGRSIMEEGTFTVTEESMSASLVAALTGNSIGQILTKLLMGMIILTALVTALFTVGRSIALLAGVGIRIIGYAAALPFGIASFASEEYQDMGKSTLKGLLSAALQGMFVIIGIYLAVYFANEIALKLITPAVGENGAERSFLYSVLGTFIMSFATMAGAEEGNALGKEVFR